MTAICKKLSVCLSLSLSLANTGAILGEAPVPGGKALTEL